MIFFLVLKILRVHIDRWKSLKKQNSVGGPNWEDVWSVIPEGDPLPEIQSESFKRDTKKKDLQKKI